MFKRFVRVYSSCKQTIIYFYSVYITYLYMRPIIHVVNYTGQNHIVYYII